MRLQVIARYVGIVLLFNALFMFISALISAVGRDGGTFPLLFGGFVTTLLGIFPLIFVPAGLEVRKEEGLAIVVAGWLFSSLIGTIPYILWGGEFTFTNAWFESVSGFTTTGSTILTNIEAVPRGLLFWRSTTHWLGGIGIIIFILAIVPAVGQAAMVLYKAEMSDLATDNLQYRTRKTLQILLVVYVGLTALETIFLVIFGMDLFDAVTHSFATVATGGFSPKNQNIAYFHSPAIEAVIMVFMILSGLHFGLIFVAITGNPRKLWESGITRYYVMALLIGILLISLNVRSHIYNSWGDALRYASFQLISLGTSTGFATTDTAYWPAFSILIMIFFSLQCACAGSTSGGIKVDRIVIFWKAVAARFKRLRHPRAVIVMRVDASVIGSDLIEASLLYITLYLGIAFISSLLLTLMGMDIISAFSGTVAAMGNVGPGFGSVSSMGNYAGVPEAGKWVLSLAMLLGRLEIFGFFMLMIYRLKR